MGDGPYELLVRDPPTVADGPRVVYVTGLTQWQVPVESSTVPAEWDVVVMRGPGTGKQLSLPVLPED